MTRARDLADSADLAFDGDTLKIDSANNRVGIGTDSPSEKAEIAGNLLVGNTAQNNQIKISRTTTNPSELRLQAFTFNPSIDFHTESQGSQGLRFLSEGSTEVMRIASNGNVGIGTTSPSQVLSLYANDTTDTQLIIEQDSTGDAGIQFSLTGLKNWTVGVDNSDGDKFKIENGNAIGGSNDFVIDSSGNVGIGTSSPSGLLSLESNNPNIRFDDSDTSNNGEITLDNTALRIEADEDNAVANSLITFRIDGSERMRIDSSGRMIMGATSSFYTDAVLQVKQTNTATSNNGCIALQNQNAATASGVRTVIFHNSSGTVIGTITNTSSSTSYNTSSDYRLKENDVDMTGAITRVKQLQPKRFNFIADADDTTVDGFMAHEVQTVVPEAITGTHNEVDDEGNPVYQGIDQSKLVPLLTGALQEAIAKIETLETEMTALKARVTALENA